MDEPMRPVEEWEMDDFIRLLSHNPTEPLWLSPQQWERMSWLVTRTIDMGPERWWMLRGHPLRKLPYELEEGL